MSDENDSELDRLLEQRRAVIAFGHTALKAEKQDDILTEACEHCRRALGTHLSKVMRLEDDGRNLRVIAGVGWDDGVVGEEVVPALETSSEGFALIHGEPAVAHDVSDDRFDYPEFLQRHGVEAMVNVVIPGTDGTAPFGLLQVDSTTPREFRQADIEFLQGYALILGAAIERFQKSEALRLALNDRERALEELQHRVKNNLAILKGLFRSKHRRSTHPGVQQEIAMMIGQIETLSRLHDLLSTSSDIDRIEIGGFLSNLASQIGSFGSEGEVECEINSQIEPVTVDSSIAIPLGIVANEFITNSIKYASRDWVCRIHLTVAKTSGAVEIVLRDEGQGLGDALEKRSGADTGSGLNHIEALLDQIGAAREWGSEEGTRLLIRLPASSPMPAATI